MTARDHQWIQGTDDVVRENLEKELARVSAAKDVGEILSAKESESHRAAFLAATKLFHPNRFARRPEDVRSLANEVFLRIKDAYESEQHEDSDARLARAKQQASEQVSDRAKSVSGAVVSDRVPSEARKEQIERRREQVKSRLGGATAAPKRTAQIRAATAAPSEEIDDQSAEEQRFDVAVGLMVSGNFPEAAAAFKALAVARPSEKRFRMHMHYCQGRVKQADEQYAEARAEYKRALGMDASFAPAHEAMSSLPGDSGRKKSGIISRLFGK